MQYHGYTDGYWYKTFRKHAEGMADQFKAQYLGLVQRRELFILLI